MDFERRKKNGNTVPEVVSFRMKESDGEEKRVSRHSEAEFIVVQKGCVTVICDGKTEILKKNGIAFFNPAEPHTVVPYEGSAVVLSLFFDISSVESEKGFFKYGRERIENIISGDTKRSRLISAYIKKIQKYLTENGEGNLIYAKGFLCLALAEAYGNGLYAKGEKKRKARLGYSEFAKKISEYTDENLSRKITVASAAEETGYSVSYFEKIFKYCFSVPYKEYITKKRIEKSKKLLSDGRMSTEDIAKAVGLSDASYFSALFEKQTGLTPSEFAQRSDSVQTNIFDSN